MVLIMKAILVLLASALMPWFSFATEVGQVRQLAAKYNVTCILVFGDSSVDPGNNNILQTTMKSNFPPYGKDFFDGRPTGRFSNGRLAPDFIGKKYTPFAPLCSYFESSLNHNEVNVSVSSMVNPLSHLGELNMLIKVRAFTPHHPHPTAFT